MSNNIEGKGVVSSRNPHLNSQEELEVRVIST